MNAREFLERNPDYFKSSPEVSPSWEASRIQALDHTTKTDKKRTISAKRPSEDKHMFKYRKDNIRYITNEGPSRFLALMTRQLSGVGLEFVEGTLPDRVDEFFKKRPFSYLSQPAGLMEYMHSCILPESLTDSNALLIVLPYDSENPETPPNLTQSPSSAFDKDVKVYVLPSSSRVHDNNDVMTWKGGNVMRKLNGDKQEKAYPFYWVADKTWYYRLLPDRRDTQGKVVYELEDWYMHDCKELPLIILPGKIMADDKGNKFKVPIIYSFYQHADETDVLFSDGQAINARFAHPKEITVPIECTHTVSYGNKDVKCVNGQIPHYKKSDDGWIRANHNIQCPHCKGTGHEPDVGIMERFHIAKSEGIDDKAIANPFSYVNPDVAVLDHWKTLPFDHLDRGLKSIGLNLLGGETESGEAKRMRLKLQEDMVRLTYFELKNLLEKLAYIIQCIYTPGQDTRPIVKMPSTLAIKDEDLLIEDAKNTLPAFKLTANLEVVEKKYGNDPRLLKVHKLALFYSPLLLLDNDEISLRVNNPSINYNENDIIKRDNAVRVFLELSEQDGFLDESKESLFEKANEMLEDLFTDEFVLTDDPAPNTEG